MVNKDTDGDGIPDWEEGLWGTDPTKKETTPGIPDTVAIEKLKSQSQVADNGQTSVTDGNTENLTQTDQFSRDLFAIIAAATQNGQPLDQATTDKISSSLAERIKNSPPRKVFTTSDIKVIKDSGKDAIQKYLGMLNASNLKYPIQGNALDIFNKAINADGSLNASALSELDPIVKSKQAYIQDVLNANVPEVLLLDHLAVLNALERLVENINDMELADSDVIIAFSAISQYQNNSDSLASAIKNLTNIINEKLNN